MHTKSRRLAWRSWSRIAGVALLLASSSNSRMEANEDSAATVAGVAGGVTASAPHPDSSATGWADLFKKDLSDAQFPKGIWKVEEGVLTATEDKVIWAKQEYENFTIDLEFKNAEGTNSGVIFYCTDMKKGKWPANSVEIQIADDFHEKWAKSPKTYQCAAIFGHLPANESRVKAAGEWNRLSATCLGPQITVALNGKVVTEMDMRKWTSASKNPDGSDIPKWLSRPKSEMATKGRIGLQGKHHGAPIYFRNVRIKTH